MTREQMKKEEEYINEAESLLLRPLTNAEIDFISEHDLKSFYRELGFDTNTLTILNDIKKELSDKYIEIIQKYKTDDFNIFDEQRDENIYQYDSDFEGDENPYLFAKKENIINKMLSQLWDAIHNQIIDCSVEPIIETEPDLRTGHQRETDDKVQQALNKFVKSQPKENFEKNLNDEVSEEVFGEVKEFAGPEALIPESLQKWAQYLSGKDIIEARHQAVFNITGTSIFDDESKLDQDLLCGEISDIVKDMAIEKYYEVLQRDKQITLEDEEIKSEVIDYLKRIQKIKKIKIINNTILL